MSNRIITIGREFGSGGKAIGQIVADKLGIKLYDKELIKLAAEESGLSQDFIESHDEKPVTSFLFSLAMDARNMMGSYADTPVNQKAFLAQFEAIKKLAERESCVIVGRCADYALMDYDNVTSVFITADMEDKIQLVSELRNITKDKAIELINKTDKNRANYYNYYSNMKWGVASTYDACINSSRCSYDGSADLIIKLSEINARISSDNSLE